MDNNEKVIFSLIKENPSLIQDSDSLIRKVRESGLRISLSRILKIVRKQAKELIKDQEKTSGYKKIVVSHESIKLRVDQEYGGSCTEASRALNVPLRTIQQQYYEPSKNNFGIKRFVVTYGQNDTPVNLPFLKSLQQYSKKNRAEIIVYKGKYRNPTSIIESNKEEEISWDINIRPYLLEVERQLNDKIVIYPSHTVPTAVRPLSGFDTHSGDKSGIFPHPKIQLHTVPTPSKDLPKILTTTGAITIPNYSKSKAGMKGGHHHVCGATIVEIVNDKEFHIRQIIAEKDGSFYDIAGGEVCKYEPNRISKDHQLDAWVGGDIHYPFHDDNAMKASFDQISRFKPKNIFLHDVLDCFSVNHHERSNRFMNTAKLSSGIMEIENEVDGVIGLIKAFNDFEFANIHIVSSNHDDALDRWLHDEKLDNLGINAEYFHYLSWQKHKSAKKVITGFSFQDAFQFSAKEKLKELSVNMDRIHFLNRDRSLIINNVDFSMHGDVGPNGARGSVLNLSKIGVKSVIGHGHSPKVIEGCIMVGVNSIIPLGYAKGPSGWLHSNCIMYPNGKRTLINSINGQYYL